MATQENNKTKILVKVHEPLIAIMQHKIDAACLKRDAYLDKALRVEAEFLRKEIATPNSDKAKNYIAAQLGDLKLKPLTLVLSPETVDLINEVCKEKNVPRDAFMNRFFLLLIASDTILSALFCEFFAELSRINSVRYACVDLVNFTEDEEGRLNRGDNSGKWTELLGEYWEANGDELSSIDLYLDDETNILPKNLRSSDYLTVHGSPNALEAIEELVTSKNPFGKIRFFLKHIGKTHEILPQYQNAMYSYPFPKISLQNLSEGYDDLETKNCIGFNTFMTDEQVGILEELDARINSRLSKKSGKDKLVAVMQKEKQARAEKTKQSLVEKAKSAGEAK